jgi:uridine phosphorylase
MIPNHINIHKTDTQDRVFIIPGSSGRSKYIANHFLENVIIKESSRGHDLYLGNIKGSNKKVGIVSTGMGCPSLDIIVNELISVGAKYLIRVGTCGSLNLDKAPLGSIVIATGAVRDESTSSNYVPKDIPALPDFDMVLHFIQNAKSLHLDYNKGVVHTKDSLMVREYELGPSSNSSKEYMNILEKSGVIASEMESSHLFILGSLNDVKTGSVLSVIGGGDDPFGLSEEIKKETIHNSIQLVIETIKKM